MFRFSRRSSRTRLAAITAGAVLFGAVGLAATAGQASADTVVNVHYSLTGTSYIKKLNATVNLGSGTLSASDDLTTGTETGTLSLPPSTISTNELGIIPVTATSEMVQDGLATGSANLSTNTITSTSTVTLKLTSLSVFGIKVPIGNNCETSPFSVTISSDAGFTIGGGGPLSGTFTIPKFQHCGLSTLVLNLTIPGPGNTLNLTLGALQLG